MRGLSALLRGLLLAAAVLAIPAAQAQSYPTRPIRLVVPFPPGGSADILGRALAQRVGEGLGQSVVVENRPGAGTAIAAELVAKAAPDGYTLMLGTVSSHAINPALNPKLPVDPLRDFTPVAPVASIPFALLVHPSVPARTVPELVGYARSKPGKLDYSSAGSGTSNHLAGELFEAMTGTYMVHIPYRGSAPALQDLIAGRVSVMFDLVLTAAPHVRSGAVRGLAVTGANRSAALPDLPTIAESGIPGYEVSAWFAVFGPAGMPRPVVDRLNAEIARALAAPDLRQRLASQGAETLAGSPDEFAAYLKAEIAKWGKVVRAGGIRPE
jgi:tripartite-type tricarboxylate transporter receptor subunit TctC